jgi:L-amino acid N-acyltransferase YncA
MKKKDNLKNGTGIEIRSMTMKDLEPMMDFYNSLPQSDRRYFRVDVTNREIMTQRIKMMRSANFDRIIALMDDKIVATGILEFSEEEWRKHHCELRTIVDPSMRHKGLGMLMLRELYHLAAEKKAEKVVVKIMRPQKAARAICHKLGLREEMVLPDYVKDTTGRKQDMIIMTGDMKEFWKELEHFLIDTDWRRHR